jgi:hypothetical protein
VAIICPNFTVGLPGFTSLRDTRNNAEDRNEEDSAEAESKGNRHSRLKEELTAPYQLFYGSVLFNEAHRPIDERIENISEM